MHKILSGSIRYLKGIGPKKAKSFTRLGINTIEDLFYYFPRRYEDRSSLIPISKLTAGSTYTIKARVLAKGQRSSFRRRGFSIVEVAVGDDTGKIFCVWFNQPYLKEYFKVDSTVILYGRVESYSGRLQMNSPEFEIVLEAEVDGPLDAGRIIPIYSLPEGITQRNFRKLIKYALDEYLPVLGDCLPYDIRKRSSLLNLASSLLNIHFPGSPQAQQQAYQRLSFEEFFIFQIPLALRKLRKKEEAGIAHNIEGVLAQDFIKGLPFDLTAAQQRVIEEIKADMASPKPMQRLLQGDVGSGKTVVAVIAALFAAQGGCQVAFMVPTEILAKQHYLKIKSQLSDSRQIRIRILTGSTVKKEREIICQEIKNGDADFIIGTHALLEGSVRFKNLGLAIIDEQHKFGVGQRALLPAKGLNPDVLIMTATPIPRTLAITLYGDLDVSVINQLPAGRLPVRTMLFGRDKTAQAYDLAARELKYGNQVYIVYPVIEESYALDIAGAKKMYSRLKSGRFRKFRAGLIHGRLKQQEQDEVMLKFKNRELDILVATTVLEVGIDMPSATCMAIENAERFGLSQLHQLRGRVGRGGLESFCLLISDPETEEARARLSAMIKYSDGFRIAEEDLKIRGPGEFFGRRQHGLTELRIGDPLTQMQLLKRAREEAIRLISADPGFTQRQNILLKERLLERFPEYEKLIVIG